MLTQDSSRVSKLIASKVNIKDITRFACHSHWSPNSCLLLLHPTNDLKIFLRVKVVKARVRVMSVRIIAVSYRLGLCCKC